MAGLISTGIAGFLSSAKFTGKQIANKAGKLVPEIVSTFVSGLSGWMMTVRGDLECRSIYARDKFITNEYVYNRIRVTEDEEIISSSIKIASFADNEDGTWLIIPDLREGDINPLSAGDLMMGYYHNPANSGVIYAVQKMTVNADPDLSQGIIVTCEEGSAPYLHMIIVRVGNTTNVDRQSFIRISSRTNCQYFYDGINSWAAYDDPEHVRCALGKADVGLIPAWAVKAVGSVKRWFGLIADGVILRGTFILKNDKTIEDELNGRETTLRSDFEIRETGITGKWQEAITAAESASNSEKSVTKMVGDFQVTAEHLTADFTRTVETATTEATGAIKSAKESAESSMKLTAEVLNLNFSKKVETATTDAKKDIDEAVSTAELKLELSAKGLELNLTNTINSEVSGARDEIKKTTEQSKSSLTQTATELAIEFSQSVTNAEGELMSQVGTAVTQNAKEWKVEVMGADADGNPNTVIAAINATPEGIEIEGKKVKITGELLAEIIKASGLNINDKFVVGKDGIVDITGVFTSNTDGNKIIIDPSDRQIKMINEDGQLLSEYGFALLGIPHLELTAYKGNTVEPLQSIDIGPGGLRVTSWASIDGVMSVHVSPFGILFEKDGKIIKEYPNK